MLSMRIGAVHFLAKSSFSCAQSPKSARTPQECSYGLAPAKNPLFSLTSDMPVILALPTEITCPCEKQSHLTFEGQMAFAL